MGSRVLSAATQATGFSPGLAARLRLEDGRRLFLKAVHVSANPDTPAIHRREAAILAALPETVPAPRLLWMYDTDGWVALCLEDIDGRHPYEPWTESDLELVITAMTRMAIALTPSPVRVDRTAAQAFAGNINGWQLALRRRESRLEPWALGNLSRLAELEAEAPNAAAGDTLLHFDTRADNLLIRGGQVYVLDWPWARTGAWWIDLVAMAPSVAMQGGPDPEAFLRRLNLNGVSSLALDAVICTMSGYFCVRALEPAPPGIPTVRAFQAAQGRAALRWLRERVGWE